MDEGIAFVPTTPTFTVMDLEALDDATSSNPSADDLMYYLTGHPDMLDPSSILDELVAAPSSTSPLLVEDLTLPLHDAYLSASSPSSAYSPLPSSSSPVSSPPQSSPFAFSSSPAIASSPQSAGDLENSDHFVFGGWVDSVAQETNGVAPSAIAPVQLQAPSIVQSPQSQSYSPHESSSDEGSPTPAPKKQTRKRKRTKKNEAPLQTAVTLPRDELLKLSSQELEEYAENLRKVRKLTAEEEKDLRRQRRLIKNRESAQLSRVRKREQMEVLEQQLQEANAEKERLRQQVNDLTKENRQLKEQIASMNQSQVRQPVALPPVDLSGKLSDEDGEPSPSLIKMVQSWTTLGKGATATAVKATYLFVILLSIGLFFNARYVNYGPGLGPLEMGPRGFPAGIYQLPPSAVVSSSSSPYEYAKQAANADTIGHIPRRHRDLLQVEDSDLPEAHMEVVPDLSAKQQRNARPEAFSTYSGATLESLDMKAKPWRKEAPTFPLHASAMPEAMTGEAANKTVLMCPSVTPLHWPGEGMGAASDEITFILPSSSASFLPASLMRGDDPSSSSSSSSSSFSATARQSNGGTVQLTCKVVDARTVSLRSLLVQ